MGEWSFVLTDRFGRNRAFLQPSGVTITRRLDGGNVATWTQSLEDEKAAETVTGSRLLKVYEDQAVRLNAPVYYVKRSAAAGTLEAAAGDWHKVEGAGLADVLEFDQVDAGLIAAGLLEALVSSPARYHHIRTDSSRIASSVKRDRAYDAGQDVAQAIIDLAEVDDPFYFRVDALDGISSTWAIDGAGLVDGAALVILYPESGTEAAVAFEYGEETLDNLSDFEEEEEPPANVALGTSDGLAPVEVEDSSSVAVYGAWYAQEAFSEVKRRKTLTEHAQGLLEPQPRKAYALTPRPGGPRPWADFDVGSLVNFRGVRGVLDVAGQGRVTEFQVEIPDQAEDVILRSLTVEMV